MSGFEFEFFFSKPTTEQGLKVTTHIFFPVAKMEVQVWYMSALLESIVLSHDITICKRSIVAMSGLKLKLVPPRMHGWY